MVSRRKTEQGRFDKVFKMMHGHSSVPATAFSQVATNSCTRGHLRKLVKAESSLPNWRFSHAESGCLFC